ncbi:MAG: Asp-tRNA(Asn)/Glu-tRNA(Gln) amidotransferase subunit GatA [Bdellovibrionota bacterium]
MAHDWQNKDLDTLHEMLRKKEISSVELTQEFLNRTKQTNEKLGTFLTIDEDVALNMAKEADKTISTKGPQSKVHGIPVAVKDIILTKNVKTTAASQLLKDFVPVYESTATSRLWNHGAVLLGKTNLDEFAMGSSNENSSFYPCKNPWDTTRVPGGSSGGSAAAVSAAQAPLALGTDTGGSIRQPAALCGIVGLKPSYGRVSRYGSIAFASSLDQIGPMAKSVKDTAYLLEAISGHDELDSTSHASAPFSEAKLSWNTRLDGKTIGIPKEYLPDTLDSAVRENFEQSVECLRNLGATIKEVRLPHTEFGISCYYIIAPAEASSNLARFDGIHYTSRWGENQSLSEIFVQSRTQGFGAEVQRRILLGTYVLSSGYYDAYYKKALQVQQLIRQDFDQAFAEVDFLITPTSPFEAFGLGSKSKDPLSMYLSDVFTVCISLAGLPAISIPCGFGPNHLPLGLQLIGKHMDEAGILETAYAFEQANDFHERRPTC